MSDEKKQFHLPNPIPSSPAKEKSPSRPPRFPTVRDFVDLFGNGDTPTPPHQNPYTKTSHMPSGVEPSDEGKVRGSHLDYVRSRGIDGHGSGIKPGVTLRILDRDIPDGNEPDLLPGGRY